MLQILDSSGSRPFLDHYDFALVHENPFRVNDIAQEWDLSNVELAFFFTFDVELMVL